MKKALAVAVFTILLAPFLLPVEARADVLPAVFPLLGQRDYSYEVASSTGSYSSPLFWVGQGDGRSLTNMTLAVTSSDPTAMWQIRITCLSNLATSTSGMQTGCVTMSAQNSDTVPIYNPTGSGLVQFTWATPVLLQSGKYYLIELASHTGSDWSMRGTAGFDFIGQCSYAGTQHCGAEPTWTMNTINAFSNPQGVATSSALFAGMDATSTLSALANQCSQSGNIFAEGLCTAGVYLFVPAPAILQQYATINQSAEAKIPFYYVSYVQSVFSPFATSTSSNLPLLDIPLSSWTSASANHLLQLPDITLSTTTISQYLSDDLRNILKALITAGIWLTVAGHVYRTAMKAPPV